MPLKRRYGLVLALAAGAIAIDQATKFLALEHLQGRPTVPLLGDLFGLTFLRNPGAALGLGSGSTWIFPVVGIVVLGILLWLLPRVRSAGWATAFGLLMGGLIGNLIDRLIQLPYDQETGTVEPYSFGHGAVIDFLDMHFFIANFADWWITFAAAIIVVLSFRGVGLDGRRETDDEPADTAPADTAPGEPAAGAARDDGPGAPGRGGRPE